MFSLSMALANIDETKNKYATSFETISKKIDSKMRPLLQKSNNRSLLDLIPIIDLLFDYHCIIYEYVELLAINKEDFKNDSLLKFFTLSSNDCRAALFVLLRDTIESKQSGYENATKLLIDVYYEYKRKNLIDEEELKEFIASIQDFGKEIGKIFKKHSS